MTDYKQLCAELVRIADALDSGTELASNQGQAMDGYSALAAFRDVAYRARAALAETEPDRPTDLQPIPLDILADIFSNTERPDKISVKLAKTTRDLSVEYRDLDDEWFKELSAALTEPEPEPPTDTELSPAARAVLDAINKELDEAPWDLTFIAGSAAAAALRAAADEAIPLTKTPWGTTLVPVFSAQESRDRLLAIANELEAQ